MGAYLSEPITDKVSSDEDGERVRYGASSMQGWRVSQEDAHNCIVDYDGADRSLFAVYDGHGGHEVALYCSQKLPEFIKQTEAYRRGDYENALIDAFLEFDATIATPEVTTVLKELAGSKDDDDGGGDASNECGSSDEASVSSLYEEAAMPIEQVMEKYQSQLTAKKNPSLAKAAAQAQGEKLPLSPYLRGRKDDVANADAAAVSTAGESSGAGASRSTKADSSNEDNVSSTDDSKASNGEEKRTEQNEADSSGLNGEIKSDEPEDSDVSSSTTRRENGEATSVKGKGKGKAKVVKKCPVTELNLKRSSRLKERSKKLYTKLVGGVEEGGDESSSEDEDESFEAVVNDGDSSSAEEKEEEEEGEGVDDDDDDDEEEEEEDDDNDDEFERRYGSTAEECPGKDSGCTAVVALLAGDRLYVANAGDSRCVLCRDGTAVDMSVDHKPEDEPEMERIEAAGGHVTADGRVDGGLNLSRAIGDHVYKANKSLPAREQMITALPDIKTITISPDKDEFMILACDGIWNYMSSQEAVDHVRERLNTEPRPKLSKICEQMFTFCLAPNTLGDGTGCDNMTAIIVEFNKRPSDKRQREETFVDESPSAGEPDTKRPKTDQCAST